MSTTYLKIEGSTGRCFESEKAPKEGYEKTETKNSQGGTVISYRKYYPEGIFGRLTAMFEKTNKFDGREIRSLCVILTDGEQRFSVDIPLLDQKGNISSFAESFIGFMPNLVQDQAYRFFPYAIEDKTNLDKNGKARKNYGIAMHVARLSDRAVDKENKIAKLTYAKWDKEKGEEISGDIPLIEWDEAITGGVTPNKKKRSKYLYDAMKQYSIEFSGAGGGVKTFNSKESSTAQTPTQESKPNAMTAARGNFEKEAPKQEQPVTEAFAEADDDDDLPF